MSETGDTITVSGGGQATAMVSGPGIPTPPPTPMDLVARALASGASMETLERMIELQERWEANEARKQFETAMADAAKEMPVISKTAHVDFESKTGGRTNYKYADLAEIVSIVAPILSKHGLSHRFETNSEPGKPITVTCRISHKNGHSITNSMSAAHDSSGNKNSIQAMGSTMTYLSRYTLMGILGLAATKDDDGQSHREPQAGPDVMAPVNIIPPPGAVAVELAQATREAAARSVAKKLTVKQIQELENEARMAADRGSEALAALWRRLKTQQERAVISGMQSELLERRTAADRLLAMANANLETGELPEA